MDKDKQAKFPSPVGELHFSMGVHMIDVTAIIMVSVPCRGTTFLNKNLYLSHFFVLRFPSPVGELHFSILTVEYKGYVDGFRPLSGNYISQ